jgi:hypothetical protein
MDPFTMSARLPAVSTLSIVNGAGEAIAWPECAMDAAPGKITCGSYCADCSGEEFRMRCLEERIRDPANLDAVSEPSESI